ncbi:MAG: hypothetical protein PHD76_02900 [Methylacidiphilales bacterium]|nr:hypothetical protein [Candidatus Methylacidiphilales bacterium]
MKQGKIDFDRLNATLSRRTHELATANTQLQRSITRCKKVEATLKNSEEHYIRLLKDSLHLQEGFRQLTRRVLAAQEGERHKVGSELQDEIVQTLLGINVRLLGLKRESRLNTRDLKNEIACTQRLVVKSTKSVRCAARKFSNS